MPPYRNLKAWRHAQRLAVECAKAARQFPPYEQEALADQLRRSAYRVATQIADASARRVSDQHRAALEGAHAALAEVETILEISHDLGYVRSPDYGVLSATASVADKTLYGLLRKAIAKGAGT